MNASIHTTLKPDAEGNERDCIVDVDYGDDDWFITDITFEDAERDPETGRYTKRNTHIGRRHPEFEALAGLVDASHIETKIAAHAWEYA